LAGVVPTPAPPRDSCPNATLWRPSCKRRACPVCGVRWARDWQRSTSLNLEAFGRPITLVSVTGPGADRLPWDETYCYGELGRRRHRHGGRNGCRVEQRALREWCDTLTWRWGKLRRAAELAVKRRYGVAPMILERAWEPQKRGVPHLHLVLPYGTPEERAVAQAFADELASRSSEYDFGFVDTRLRAWDAHGAARYIASYLVGKRNGKATIRENIADPNLPTGLLWLTPKLTRRTALTIRTLRRARHLWAALDGRCPEPRWTSLSERLRVEAVYRRLYDRDRDAPRPSPLLTPAELRELELADGLERELGARFVYGPQTGDDLGERSLAARFPAPELVAA
jgi:hypothetical protein